ncbi:MAG: tetratricopeptide repeat protein [Candidatus Saliniplasma sp.]
MGRNSGRPPLDIEDIILLYIGESSDENKGSDLVEVNIDQIGIEEDRVRESLSSFEESGLISQKRESEGEGTIYCSLSEKGEKERQEIWDGIKEKKTVLIDDKDTVELKIKNIKKILKNESIIHMIQNIDKDNILDLRDESRKENELVGRDEELETLKDIIRDVRSEDTKTVFISGGTGIGKTRLVEELKKSALEMEADFLKGNCLLEVQTPYAPFKKALEKFSEIESETDGIISTGKMTRPSDERAKSHRMFDAQRKSVFYGTTNFLKNLSESRPMVLVLDDLQWADKGTLNLLNYMSDRLRGDPVLIIGTYRPGDVPDNHPLTEIMRMMSRKKLYGKIELKPLDKGEIKDIVSRLTDIDKIPENFVESMKEKTNGNPLFIKESVKQMVKKEIIDVNEGEFPTGSDIVLIPDIVQDVIEKRVFELDEETREILQLGSVIGKEIPFDLLVNASGKNNLELLEKIDYLLENNIWQEHPREEVFSFSHDLFVDIVYQGLGKWLEQKQLHLKIAETIETVYEEDLDNKFSTLGHHYRNAEEYGKAFDYIIKAAEKAENVYAHEDAIERYEEALRIADKTGEIEGKKVIPILEELGYTYKIIGDYEKSREYLEKALTRTSDLESRRRLYGKIANLWSDQGNFDKVITITEEGLKLKGDDKITLTGEEDEEKAIREEEDTPEICHLLSIKGWALRRTGRYQEAEEVFYEDLERAKELDDKFSLAKAYHNLGSFERSEMKTEDCIEYLKKSIALAKEILKEDESFKIKYLLSGSYNNLGATYAISGDLDNAAIHLENALEIHHEINNKISEVTTLNNLSLLYKDKGDLEKSEELLVDAFDILKKIDYKQGRLLVENSQGVLYLEKGKFDMALPHLENALDIAEMLSFRYKICDISNNLSKTYLMKGNIDEGEVYADKALDVAEDIESNRLIGDSLKNKGKANRLNGDFDEAVKYHKKGIESAERSDESTTPFENIFELVKDHLAADKVEMAQEELGTVDEVAITTDEMVSEFKMLNGIVIREMGDYEDSEKLLTEALKGYEKLSRKYNIARIYYEIGELKKLKGEEKESKRYIEMAEGLFEEMDIELMLDKIAEI